MSYVLFKYFLLLIIVYTIGIKNISYAKGEPITTTKQSSVVKYQPCKPIKNESIAALQFEMTSTEDKITIVDQLSQMDDKSLQNCLYTSSDKELVGLTIIELSRHTNSQLAKKAQDLCKRFNIVSYIEETINKDKGLETVANLLLRIEPDQVTQILDALPDSEKKEFLVKFFSDRIHAVLIPTSFKQGDRYYVKATWDTQNEKQVTCLTRLFNKKLNSNRSLEEEKDKMKELNGERLIYWYSKEWALERAEEIFCCGGKAEFINGNKN